MGLVGGGGRRLVDLSLVSCSQFFLDVTVFKDISTTDAPSPFFVLRIIHNFTSSPASSPYHPALYSPAFNPHSPLVQLTVTLPPSLSAFELPGKVRLGWSVLLGSMIGGGWADEWDGWDPSTGPW